MTSLGERKIRFGVVLYWLDLLKRPQSFWEHAEEAEKLGFDTVLMGDHYIWHVPVIDGLSVLATMVSRTSKIRLGNAVLQLPLRGHPSVTAKTIATLDIMSNGRIEFGAGVGGEAPQEWINCGVPVSERGRRTDEALSIMRKLWTEDHVTFEGKFYRVQDATMEPKPVQKPHPPISIGGRTDAAIMRTARFGDAWMPAFMTAERLAEGAKKLKHYAEKVGRDPSSIEVGVDFYTLVANSHDEARRKLAPRLARWYNIAFEKFEKYVVIGTSSECTARIRRYAEVGCSYFWLILADDPSTQMERYADEVIPHFRRR